MDKKQIIDKIINDLPTRDIRGEMSSNEWYGLFEEAFDKGYAEALRLFNVLPKTRKCDWCDKSKSVEQGYWLGKFENSKKDWFICVECNLKHDVV